MQVGAAGLEVKVSYSTMKPGHVIALKFNGDDRLVPIEAGTGTSVSFRVPVSYVAAALGQTVAVQYVVGGTGGGATSEILQLSILPFMEGDLPMSEIIGAKPPAPGELDLGIVEGDPVFRISPWPLMSVGQSVWLDLSYQGEQSNGTIPIMNGEKVTAANLITGITHPVLRTDLKKVLDGSLITLPLMVNFSGNDSKDDSISFPTLSLIVRQEGQGGIEFTEDFEKYQSGKKNISLRY